MLRSEARDLVRMYLDDDTTASSARWSDAQINAGLARAQKFVVVDLVSNGWAQPLITTASSTISSSGVITVPAHEKIINIFLDLGSGNTVRIKPGTRGDRNVVTGLYTGAVVLDLILASQFPSDDITNIDYCQVDLNNPMVDQLMCLQCAKDLKSIENEVNAGQIALTQEIREQVLSQPISPNIWVSPFENAWKKAVNGQIYQMKWFLSSSTEVKVYI